MIRKVKKLWGNEEWLVNNDKYCAKYLNLKKGYQCSLHYHIKKDETFYILKGKVKLEVCSIASNDKTDVIVLTAKQQVRLRPCIVHRFTSLTRTSKILEVSTTHFDEDSYRLINSGKITKGET